MGRNSAAIDTSAGGATRCTGHSRVVNAPISVPTITGDGLRLRPWALADVEALEAACGDPDICRFTTVPHHYTQEAATNWIRRQHKRISDGAGVVLAIEPESVGQPVGLVGLFGLGEPGQTARFGYWILLSRTGFHGDVVSRFS